MLTWDWNDKIGYLIVDGIDHEKVKVNLYGGNALMIAVTEWKEDDKDMYGMWSFFADRPHARRCLGLEKNSDYIMDNVIEIHLNSDLTDKRIASLVNYWAKAIKKYKLDVKIILEYAD